MRAFALFPGLHSLNDAMLLVAALMQVFTAVICQQASTGRMLTIQHCFDDDLQFRCRRLTELPATSLRANQTQSFTYQLSSQEVELLKAAAAKDDFYFVRAVGDTEHYMQSFCRAKGVAKNSPYISIVVNVDTFGRPFGVEVFPMDERDPRLLSLPDESADSPDLMTGLITVHGSQPGPSPDLEGFKRKVAKEKAEKMAAESGDNRSFLAKYWMYIVPVVIFMLFSGQLGGQGGGGGGAAA